MGWEYRGNRLYYYRKKREGVRVTSEYMGTGPAACLIAELDQEDQPENADKMTTWKKQRNEQKKIDSSMDQLQKSINSVVRAIFLTSGYHTHKGQWRKVRHG